MERIPSQIAIGKFEGDEGWWYREGGEAGTSGETYALGYGWDAETSHGWQW